MNALFKKNDLYRWILYNNSSCLKKINSLKNPHLVRVSKNFKFRVIGFLRMDWMPFYRRVSLGVWFVTGIGFLKKKLTDIGFFSLAFSGFWINNFSSDLDWINVV